MVIKWEERRSQWSVGRCRLNLTTCYLLRGREGGRRKSVVRRIADMQPAAAAGAGDLARPHARGLEIYEEEEVEEEEDDEEGRSRSVRGN